jgi:hypothetical protein
MGKKFNAWPTKWEFDHQIFRCGPMMRVKVDLPHDEMRAVRKIAEARGMKIADLAAQLLHDAVLKASKNCAKCGTRIDAPALASDEPERCASCA